MMSDGWAQEILSEVQLPFAKAQLVESHYDPGSSVVRRETDVMVRWRLWPNKIKVCAWQKDGVPSVSGKMMFIPPDIETGAFSSDEENTRSLSLQIMPSWLKSVAGVDGDPILESPRICVDLQDSNMEHAMRRLASELTLPGPCSRILLEACTLSVAGDLVRHFNQTTISAEAGDILTSKRLHRIEQFVMNYTNGCPTLAEIAADLDISVGYLRQVFKKSTGKTLYKFIEEVRLARAQSMLATRKTPMKVIAHELGFCSSSAFSLAFRKATGLSPRDYRVQQA
jgi:AraC-like DNA-binding protein